MVLSQERSLIAKESESNPQRLMEEELAKNDDWNTILEKDMAELENGAYLIGDHLFEEGLFSESEKSDAMDVNEHERSGVVVLPVEFVRKEQHNTISVHNEVVQSIDLNQKISLENLMPSSTKDDERQDEELNNLDFETEDESVEYEMISWHSWEDRIEQEFDEDNRNNSERNSVQNIKDNQIVLSVDHGIDFWDNEKQMTVHTSGKRRSLANQNQLKNQFPSYNSQRGMNRRLSGDSLMDQFNNVEFISVDDETPAGRSRTGRRFSSMSLLLSSQQTHTRTPSIEWALRSLDSSIQLRSILDEVNRYIERYWNNIHKHSTDLNKHVFF